MNLDDYQNEWENQPMDQIASRCQTIVHSDTRRRRRTVTWMAVFFVLSLASAWGYFLGVFGVHPNPYKVIEGH